MHNFTPEDLISYLYKETTAETTAAIEEAIANSWTLREKLDVIRQSIERLDTIIQAPRKEVVSSVLAYARRENHVAAH